MIEGPPLMGVWTLAKAQLKVYWFKGACAPSPTYDILLLSLNLCPVHHSRREIVSLHGGNLVTCHVAASIVVASMRLPSVLHVYSTSWLEICLMTAC